jgi:hypothetical protein
MKIWLIKLLIIVAVVAGMTCLAFYGYKNFSPYERCVDGGITLGSTGEEYSIGDEYGAEFWRKSFEGCRGFGSHRNGAQCIEAGVRLNCKKTTHW